MTAPLRLCLLAWLALAAPAEAPAADYGFHILRAELKPDPQGKAMALNADIDYRFSEPALDALRNGVSLTLVLRLKIKRERHWRWDATVLDQSHPFHIRYHALSKLYQLIDGDGEPRNFVSVNALLEVMGSLRGLPVPLRLPPKVRHNATLAVGLDIESLPLPLRPVAYATPAWYLGSPVYRWTFAY